MEKNKKTKSMIMGNPKTGRKLYTCPECGSGKALLLVKGGSKCPDCHTFFPDKNIK